VSPRGQAGKRAVRPYRSALSEHGPRAAASPLNERGWTARLTVDGEVAVYCRNATSWSSAQQAIERPPGRGAMAAPRGFYRMLTADIPSAGETFGLRPRRRRVR
jgi:hypothetical protein